MTPYALGVPIRSQDPQIDFVQITRQDGRSGYVTGSGPPHEKVGQRAATPSHSGDHETSMNLRNQSLTDLPPSQFYHRTATPHNLQDQEYRWPDAFSPPAYQES